MHIDPVVVGVARGGSDAAVRFAALEARRAGRPLDLLHVAPGADGWEGQLGRDSLRMAVRRARGLAGDLLEVRSRTRTGDPLAELSKAASDAALLVLERRRPAVLRRREGSFTERIADAIEVPLVSVPGEWTLGSHGVITVGLDVRHADHRALRTAIRLARLQGAVLRVLVAVPPRLPGPRAYAEGLLAQLGADACDLALELAPGDAGGALLALSHQSDLLILGRHRPPVPSGSLLGTTSRSVLRNAACPVWLTTPGHDHATPNTNAEQPASPYASDAPGELEEAGTLSRWPSRKPSSAVVPSDRDLLPSSAGSRPPSVGAAPRANRGEHT